jgi:AraC-like DNA-binding protein
MLALCIPGPAIELKAFFGSEITFGATVDELSYSTPIEQLAVVSADPYLNELLLTYCEEALASRPTKPNAFRLSVEKAIAQSLPHGKVQAKEVARQLGMSRRTLTKRLSSEDLTFANVLQSLKSDLANRHLKDANLSISKIAWLLGYQDSSAFTHAFKRWTGKPPKAARHDLRVQ